mmetsp:Transcript_32826/g.51306  ORF Transcript_32826/g.51306 Transcript_32826/m.51306 type:complete len:236 (-) Transcript_32826:28-735(-)
MTEITDTDILAKLSSMQNSLNCFIDKSWVQNRSLDDWSLAIILESAELIESYPWKWWKSLNASVDMKNVRIELVDILHFALSGAAQAHSQSPLSDITAEKAKGISRTAVVTQGTKEAIQVYRDIIRDADAHDFHIIVHKLFAIARHYGFNIIAYYCAKFTLNVIRQIGGYKANTYKKVSHEGMEDNEMLHSCIKDISTEEIIDNFESTANSIFMKVYDVFDIPSDSRKTLAQWIE